MARNLAKQLSANLETQITVSKVRYRVNKNLLVRDLLIKDDFNDTALFIPKLDIQLKNLDFNTKKLQLKKVKIFEPYSNLFKTNSGTLNITNLIENIKPKDKRGFKWHIQCNELSLLNSTNKYNATKADSLIIDNLSAFISDIFVDSNIVELKSDLIFLSLNNKNTISDLSFRLMAKDNQYRLDSLFLQTPNSEINLNKADIIRTDNNFKGQASFLPSDITLKDFDFLSPELSEFKSKINLAGNFNFDNKTITGNKLRFYAGKESSVHADFRLVNYKDKKNFAYYINFENGFTNKSDITNIAKDFFNIDTLAIPKELKNLGGISYQGIIQGSTDSIKSQGTFYSDAGIIESNLLLEKSETPGKFLINGQIETQPINLNVISNNNTFGKLSLNIETKGFYSKQEGINLNLDGYINHIVINQRSLDSIQIIGQLSDNYFNGHISSFDPNLRADFDGEVFLGGENYFDFSSNIYYANLFALGLIKSDSLSNISVNIEANFSGKKLENSIGKIIISDLFYFQDSSYIATDSIIITSEHYNNEKRLSLRSEFLDVDFNGVYYIPTLINDFTKFANIYSPSIFTSTDTNNYKLNNFRFKIDAKYPQPLTENFLKHYNISSGTQIEGVFNSKNMNLMLTCEADEVTFFDKTAQNFKLRSFTKKDKFYINIESEDFKYAENNNLKNLLLSLNIKNDTIKTNLNWNNWLDNSYSGNINAEINILSGFSFDTPIFKTTFSPSNIIIIDTVWTLNQCYILKDSTGINFRNVELKKGNSELSVNGKISRNPSDSILLGFKNINLYNLNVLLKKDRLKFGGSLNGKTKLQDLYGNRIINSDFNIHNFTVNNEIVGNTHISSIWDKKNKQLNLLGYSLVNDTTTLKFDGFISTVQNQIAIDLNFINQDMKLLEAFLKPTFDNISGKLSGKIHIFGPPKYPKWEGVIHAKNTTLRVVPTNTMYSFSDSIYFSNYNILFKNIRLRDKEDNYALLNGTVSNVSIRDFSVDMLINTDRILALDTKYNHHPYYYGQVYGAGIVSIEGPIKDVKINISATTLNNSIFYIPLEGQSDLKENDFITFVDKSNVNLAKKTEEDKTIKKTDLQARTTITMDLEVTPSTEIQIIFDPQIGDLLKARGNAIINIDSKPDDFGIYGDFIIDRGEFLFTIQDVLNKKLEIAQGSSVSWTGHPIDANIDLDAIYSIRRASIHDYTQEPTDSGKYVPVNCHMLMTNKLTNPDINFQIEITSNSDNIAIEQINSLPEEEITKQVLSLMLLNKFAPVTTANSGQESSYTASLGATTVSELLSNQLSYWMSQINSDFDLNFTYRPGFGDVQNEYELGMSTTLWDDRVTVYGNVGYGGHNIQAANPNSPYTTEFMIEFKMNQKGNIRLRAFNKENDDIDEIDPAAYKQGIGIFYTEEFDDFTQLMQRMFRKDVANRPEEIELEEEET